MKKLLNYFHDWNTFEKLYLIIGLTLTVVSTLINGSDALQLIYSSFFLINAILLSKGKAECYFFAIFGTICYIIISFRQHYYGETIINSCLYLPMAIYGLLRWQKSEKTEDNTVLIATLEKKKIIMVILSQLVMMFGYYFILNYFHTENIYLSVLSIMFSVMANYFQAQISVLSLYSYIGVDTVISIMWLIPILQGQTELITVLIAPVLLIISDIYGIYNWHKLQKEQNN